MCVACVEIKTSANVVLSIQHHARRIFALLQGATQCVASFVIQLISTDHVGKTERGTTTSDKCISLQYFLNKN